MLYYCFAFDRNLPRFFHFEIEDSIEEQFRNCKMFLFILITLFTSARSSLRTKQSQSHNTPLICSTDIDCSFPRGVCVAAASGVLQGYKKCLCRSPYAGDTCKDTEKQLLCEPHCLNKGYCQASTKTCECPAEYVGETCQAKCPIDGNNQICSGHGDCSMTKKVGAECFCTPGWTGKTCSRQICPSTDKGECSGSGKCINGKCQCLETFTGKACTERVCNINCNGNGKCQLATQTCKCNNGWYGKNCELKICPSTRFGTCGGHGMCDETTGLCSCDESWSGGACHVPRCIAGSAAKDCSGHGRCRGDKCHCGLGWAGAACQKQVCPMGCLENAGRGKCIGGNCECKPGFVGKACESKEPIPLACGAPCQTKCMQLPVANDSVEHCEQIKPIDISPDGTFPVAVVATESSSSVENEKDKDAFPGFKCYQMCLAKCLQGCFDQMHPMMAGTFQ